MENYNSSLPNCILPEPELKPSKEPINFGISLFTPVSSVDGSSTFFFLQPLIAGKVFASIIILIISQIVMFIADRFFGLAPVPIDKRLVISPDQTVRMSLSDLQDFLASMSRSKDQSSAGTSVSAIGQDEGGITPETPEIPLIFALAVWGDFQAKAYSPSVFLLFPIIIFPGIRGALPMLVLELLTTIFVRAVVPPQTTGSKPLTSSSSSRKSESLQFSRDDLLNLFNRFSKLFGKY